MIDIDIVYMWVDGNDPKWQQKKAQACGLNVPQNNDLAGKCRYTQNDELKYSLRSLQMYAPWIHHIYIVTDNQTPGWLDISNPKITVIDHRDIIDEKYLPLFNSSAIELNIAKIPGLSEHFLLANDDTFFGRKVDPSFFFTEDGKAIVRLKNKKIVSGFSHYQDLLHHMVQITKERDGDCTELAPHHNIDAYTRTEWLECLVMYDTYYRQTMTHRIRTQGDMHRHLITLWMLHQHKAVTKLVNKYNGIDRAAQCILASMTQHYAADSRYVSMRKFSLWLEMWYHNPALFVINDDAKTKDRHRRRMRRYLQRRFPDKSEFEK